MDPKREKNLEDDIRNYFVTVYRKDSFKCFFVCMDFDSKRKKYLIFLEEPILQISKNCL